MRSVLLVLCLGVAAAQPRPAALTADQIARNVQDRDTGRDSRAELRMKLFDRRGRVRERALALLTLRRSEGDRSLIRFTYPNDIRGTGFLVWEHPEGKPRLAYRLESKRKDTSVAFPRIVSLILQDSYVVVQADVYNRRNDKQK